MHSALDWELEAHREETVVRHAGDDSIHLRSDLVAEELQEFDLDELGLGGFGSPFHLAAMIAQDHQLFSVRGRSPRTEPSANESMHRQVRITTDGRSKVAVVFGGESIVAALFR